LLGGAAAWPLAANSQQPAMPVVGFLNPTSAESNADRLRGFHRGLKEAGYVEGESVAVIYRWAEGQNERLPELAADLARRNVSVIATFTPAAAFAAEAAKDQFDRLPDLAAELARRRVAVIAAIDTPAAIAAKAATTTVPVVFASGGDPVREGLVASLSRPGGNVTGVNFLASETGTKLLGLLLELLPGTKRIAALVDPKWPFTEPFVADVSAAAVAIGKPIDVLPASTGGDIDAVFANSAQKPVGALVVGPSALMNSRRVQITTLNAYHRVPAIYTLREFIEVGGLMSYGASITDAQRQAGIYAGRILKGQKPADLPVMQSTKFEFAINLNTAKAFGLSFPPGLLAIADEVIE
jgi:putative ABC transport system substrate-binding protein